MTELRKDVTIPAVPERTENRVAGFKCDLCGKTTDRSDNYDGVNWACGEHNTNRITVQQVVGSECSDGGWKRSEEFHICPDCWNRVKEWMLGQGATPTKRETDW